MKKIDSSLTENVIFGERVLLRKGTEFGEIEGIGVRERKTERRFCLWSVSLEGDDAAPRQFCVRAIDHRRIRIPLESDGGEWRVWWVCGLGL